MCIVLYFEIILFEINVFYLKKTLSILRTNTFAEKIKLTPIQGCSHLISMPQAFDCDPQAVTGSSQSSVVNSMQKGPSEIAAVQISRTEYITKCYHNMVDQIPQKRILRPWNQWESHCLHGRPHIWNSHTSGASRHHGRTRGNSRLNKR